LSNLNKPGFVSCKHAPAESRMIAITQGDPVGIGPEVTLKSFAPTPRRIHIGEPALYEYTARFLGINLPIRTVTTLAEAEELPPDIFAVLPPLALPPGQTSTPLQFGTPDPAQATTTIQSIRLACQLAMEGKVKAIVTPPINKSVIHEAGYNFPGHTEMLAEYAGVKHPVMMLAASGLRVVPATIHQALSEVSKSLTKELLEQIICTTWRAMQVDFGLMQPRITVTGLNPHAGEAGAFGREELETIAPICQQLNSELAGEIRGPLPADTLFHEQARAEYDVIICMYHDQALIPLKMLGFGKAVNLTLGLPFVRTSVDHGTAYNIAGKGIADPTSFKEAVQLAELLVKNRQKFSGNLATSTDYDTQ
jgi:4-hydroxythreonine-4-phosphate dehydrogenase